jgi:hypothetical protein
MVARSRLRHRAALRPHRAGSGGRRRGRSHALVAIRPSDDALRSADPSQGPRRRRRPTPAGHRPRHRRAGESRRPAGGATTTVDAAPTVGGDARPTVPSTVAPTVVTTTSPPPPRRAGAGRRCSATTSPGPTGVPTGWQVDSGAWYVRARRSTLASGAAADVEPLVDRVAAWTDYEMASRYQGTPVGRRAARYQGAIEPSESTSRATDWWSAPGGWGGDGADHAVHRHREHRPFPSPVVSGGSACRAMTDRRCAGRRPVGQRSSPCCRRGPPDTRVVVSAA